MSDDPFLIKNLFNRDTIGIVAEAVAGASANFDRQAFVDSVFDDDWDARELKARMRHAAQCLRAALPGDYRSALAVLVAAAPGVKDAGFAAMILSDFVEAFGIDDFEASVPALAVFTRNVSAEFAVRPFLLRYPERMLDQMERWAADEDPAIRRLASEGSRPRLPWGLALKPFQADPGPILPLLAKLSHDSSPDVRRSVANSLNDIARDHPDLVVQLLEDWADGTDEVLEITKHALRVLAKRGHPGALRLIGFQPNPAVAVEELAVEPEQVAVGGKVSIRFVVRSTGDRSQPVRIDRIVHFARPSGASRKVFAWKTAELAPGERLPVKRSITLQPLSTRRIHPGTHACEVQVNGSRLARITFEVLPA